MKNFYLIVLSLILSFPAFSQITLKGHVLDQTNDRSLSGATIFAIELNKKATTDNVGNFELSLPKGTHHISCTFIGYREIIKVITLNDTTNSTLEFIAKQNPVEIEEVTIVDSYSHHQTMLKSEALTVNNLSSRGFMSLSNALASLKGASEITTGPYIGRPVIRGLSGNRIAIISDGTRLENQQWDDEHGLGISETGVEKAQLIKGPSSLMYGSSAMGGVIELIDEKPAATGHTEGDVRLFGATNGFGVGGNADLKGSSEKYFWNISGGARSLSDYYANSQRVANSRMGEGSGKITVGTARKWGSTKLSYLYNQSFFGIVEANEAPGAESEEFPREAEAPYHTVTYQKASSRSVFLLGTYKAQLNLAYQNDDRAEFEPNGTKEGAEYLHMTLNTAQYDLKLISPEWHRFEIALGTQGMIQANKNQVVNYIIPNANVTENGVFALANLNLKDLTISGGLRSDQNIIDNSEMGISTGPNYMTATKRAFSAISYSAGATYSFMDHFIARANYGQGFRNPNLAELYSNGIKLETQRFEKGNASFGNEYNKEWDASLEARFGRISVEGAIFRNDIQNYIYLAPSNAFVSGKPAYFYNSNDAIIKGVEASLGLKITKNIEVESAYTQSTGTLNNTGNIPFFPANRVNNTLLIRAGKIKSIQDIKVRASALAVLDQNSPALEETRTGGYTLFNAGLSCMVKVFKQKLEISLYASNFTNKAYVDHLSRLKNAGVPNMGSNVVLSLRCPFTLK